MTLQHEHEFEASPGLPEALPPGERIVWQGAPDAWLLAVHALHVRKLALYFAGMLCLQALFLRADGAPLAAPLALSATLALLALGLLGATAWLSARTTLYTLTNRRVVMRVGIVLTLSFNLPLRQIEGASLKALAGGAGDIALSLKRPNRIAYVHLWPHARAWELRNPQPTLRCLPQSQSVGALILTHWQAAHDGAAMAEASSNARPAGGSPSGTAVAA